MQFVSNSILKQFAVKFTLKAIFCQKILRKKEQLLKTFENITGHQKTWIKVLDTVMREKIDKWTNRENDNFHRTYFNYLFQLFNFQGEKFFLFPEKGVDSPNKIPAKTVFHTFQEKSSCQKNWKTWNWQCLLLYLYSIPFEAPCITAWTNFQKTLNIS